MNRFDCSKIAGHIKLHEDLGEVMITGALAVVCTMVGIPNLTMDNLETLKERMSVIREVLNINADKPFVKLQTDSGTFAISLNSNDIDRRVGLMVDAPHFNEQEWFEHFPMPERSVH